MSLTYLLMMFVRSYVCMYFSQIAYWFFFVFIGYFQNLDLDPGLGPTKTWTQKNVDPEKPGP